VTEEKKPTEKTLEMRVAAIEDILAKRQITEEEMKTYQKVSNLLYGPSYHCHYPSPTPPDYNGRPLCGPGGGYIGPCFFCRPVCYECFCVPCSSSGGGSFGGRFGGFGF
jgi:hypothetical protein